MSFDILEKIKEAIDQRQSSAEWEEVGVVRQVADGIARISGLRGAESQEVLMVETPAGKVPALALNLEEHLLGALLLGESAQVVPGQQVTRTKESAGIMVSEAVLGRVVDPLGNPLDGHGPLVHGVKMPLEQAAPGVLDRQPVSQPLHTGIKAIDAMIPIGRGQRELVIGDRQTGKTALALDMIINQAAEGDWGPVCVYVAVGQKESKVAKMVETLKQHGAFSRTVVVLASASSPAASWYLAPFAGCAIGEYFRDKGQDALVIYDDLSKHAWAWRQISLLLRRPPGREAYPGDVFYLHSRLLERAAKLSDAKGGGSLTAIPIIETQAGDVTAYVPTNVISITDGQIYLEADLFFRGVRPAVNVGLSVSRVGSMAQTKAMKKVAGKLRLQMAQFRELQAFAQFSADVDPQTREKIHKGRVLTAALSQSDLAPMPFEEQVAALYAALNGFFDPLDPDAVADTEKRFIEYLRARHPEILQAVRDSKMLEEATEQHLRGAIESFMASR